MRLIQSWIHAELNEASTGHTTSFTGIDNGSGDLKRVMSRYHASHTVQLDILTLAKHSRTPGDNDSGLGFLSRDAPNETLRLGVGGIRYGAGVDHTHVGRAQVTRDENASGLRLLPHAFGIVLVGLTPERMEKNLHATRPPSVPAHPQRHGEPAKALIVAPRTAAPHLNRHIQGRQR